MSDTAIATGFVVTIPGPGQTRPIIDKLQSQGMRESEDTREFIPLVFPFHDPDAFQKQLAGLAEIWGEPDAWYPAGEDNPYGLKPTIFTTEDAAKRTVEEARARAEVHAVVAGTHPNFGAFDQYRIVPAATLEVKRDLEERVREAKLRAQLSEDERLQRGQALRGRPPAALPASLRAGRIAGRTRGGGSRLD